MSFVFLFVLEVALEPYLPLVPATLLYRSPADDFLTVEVLAVQIEGAPAAVRMGSDRRRRVESFHAEEGLLVHRLGLGRSGEVVYERPLPILPAHLKSGEVYTSRRTFMMRGGFKLGAGDYYVEAELLDVEDLTLGSEVHPECLRIRRHETRTDFDQTQEVYDATEWYARGIGLVKVQGERSEKSADGEILSTVVIDLSLVTSAAP